MKIIVGTTMLMFFCFSAFAQQADRRPIFDFHALQKQKWELVSKTDLSSIVKGFSLIILQHSVPEGEEKGLSKINRVFIIDGDRVEFDSFLWDKVGDTVEPSTASKTFFGVKVQVQRAQGKTFFLVMTGIMPTHLPGDPITTTNRLLVVQYDGDKKKWETVGEATSSKAITVSGNQGIIKW